MTKTTVKQLILEGVIEEPMDGNHGEIHPTTKDYVSDGIPFLMASDIENSIINFESCKYITEKTAKGLRKGFAKNGDVLLTHKATIGRTAILNNLKNEYAVLTPQVTYYRILDDKILNNKYLKYYFDSPEFQYIIKKRAGAGSTRAYIGILQQQDLPITYPDIEIQNKIADTLSLLDEKISNNNAINAELEAMAKTIYDYWFLQFEFPNEEGNSYKSSGGKMVWNEELKREIPEGWKISQLQDVLSTIIDRRGVTPKKLGGDWVEKGIIALSAKIVKNNKLLNLNEANQVSEEMYKRWMSEELESGDILMTSEAPLGEFYYLVEETKYCLSQRLFAMRANKKICDSSYLFFELSEGNGYSQIMGSQSGSTVFGIRQDELRKIKVLVPSLDVQKKFGEYVMPLIKKIRNNDEENRELTALRDFLLPLLMNGQVHY